VAFIENELDETRRKLFMYNDANEVVQATLNDGYRPQNLIQIMKELGRLSTKGQPLTSIERLLDGLQNVKRLEELDSTIMERTSELSVINKSLNKAKGSLKGIKNATLNEIESTSNFVKTQMTKTFNLHHSDMRNLYREYANHVKISGEDQISTINNLSKEANDKIITLENSARYNLDKIEQAYSKDIHILKNEMGKRLTEYEAQVKKWGDEKQKIGRFGLVFNYAETLLDFIEHRGNTKNIPIEFMEKFALALNNWIVLNLPNVNVYPSEYQILIEPKLSRFDRISLNVMSSMIHEYLAHRVYEN
jgi:hypothetical protein